MADSFGSNHGANDPLAAGGGVAQAVAADPQAVHIPGERFLRAHHRVDVEDSDHRRMLGRLDPWQIVPRVNASRLILGIKLPSGFSARSV
jgi:hypothetical protein